MKTAILVFPGTNRERDAAGAVESISGTKPAIIWHQETEIPEVDLIILPGGFSFGDYLRVGAIAARSPIIDALHRKADAGVTVLGICNGFQILTETGLLPGSLIRNRDLDFICRDIHLRVVNTATRFSMNYTADQIIRFPVAHHDGNYFADTKTLRAVEDNDQVVLRYCDPNGEINAAGNPNGSVNNIAGVTNKAGNVMGLMPHPENLIDHLLGGVDGRALFESLLGRAA
jgi:phosphoribosylformylglycinamidine synthase subunit PurQ / glutaminase